MTNEALEERLQRIETHVATLEHTLDQLNAVVIEQGKLLRKLLSQAQQVSETVTNIELERIRSTNPKPPHYQ